MSHCVIVTFGNSLRDQKYVSSVTEQEALTHCRVAKEKGYRDAKVWVESKFDAAQRKKARERQELRRFREQVA